MTVLARALFFTWKVPSARDGQDSRQALLVQVKGIFPTNDRPLLISGESPRLNCYAPPGRTSIPLADMNRMASTMREVIKSHSSLEASLAGIVRGSGLDVATGVDN